MGSYLSARSAVTAERFGVSEDGDAMSYRLRHGYLVDTGDEVEYSGPMRYRDFHVKETDHNSIRVISTGPLLAWWVFLGKCIVMFWPAALIPLVISSWLGVVLGIMGEFAWLLLLAWRVDAKSTETE